jgi:hypothetical protein
VIFFDWDNMLNYTCVIDFQIIIALGKNIKELFHQFYVPLLDLRAKLSGQLNDHDLWPHHYYQRDSPMGLDL